MKIGVWLRRRSRKFEIRTTSLSQRLEWDLFYLLFIYYSQDPTPSFPRLDLDESSPRFRLSETDPPSNLFTSIVAFVRGDDEGHRFGDNCSSKFPPIYKWHGRRTWFREVRTRWLFCGIGWVVAWWWLVMDIVVAPPKKGKNPPPSWVYKNKIKYSSSIFIIIVPNISFSLHPPALGNRKKNWCRNVYYQ